METDGQAPHSVLISILTHGSSRRRCWGTEVGDMTPHFAVDLRCSLGQISFLHTPRAPPSPQPYFAYLCHGSIKLSSSSKGGISPRPRECLGVEWPAGAPASHCVLDSQGGWVWPQHCQALPREEVSMFTGNARQGLGGGWRRGSLPPGALKMFLGSGGAEGRCPSSHLKNEAFCWC